MNKNDLKLIIIITLLIIISLIFNFINKEKEHSTYKLYFKVNNNALNIKKLGLIIMSVILFTACETNHTCECKYDYWGFTGELINGDSYTFKSGETPCEYFDGKDVHEELW